MEQTQEYANLEGGDVEEGADDIELRYFANHWVGDSSAGPNVSDQTPAALDSANTTDASSRLAASVLFVIGFSWWFLL